MGNRFVARVISGGRVTIPETIRELLGVKDGDLVEVQIESITKIDPIHRRFLCEVS